MLEPGLRGVQRSRLTLGGKSGPRGHETAPALEIGWSAVL